ncbi:hypothetical protein MBLNU457_5030t1 [Dothideomycetes sp. NU457]
MFGLLISGRPVNPQPEQVGSNQYAFRVPSNPPFSHLALFLLPGSSFPAADVGATVWVQIPPSTEFRLLGALAPQKQSAIFKINTGTSGGGAAMARDDEGDVMVDETSTSTTSQPGPEIVIGISLDQASSVEAQLASLKGQSTSASSNALVKAGGAQTGSPVSTKVLAQRIIGNAFNFLASFGSETVPLKAFQDWWTKFEKKVDLDPSFLEREQG